MGRRHASELAWRATFSCPEGQGYEGRETPAYEVGCAAIFLLIAGESRSFAALRMTFVKYRAGTRRGCLPTTNG
jgi:hypothetical protein